MVSSPIIGLIAYFVLYFATFNPKTITKLKTKVGIFHYNLQNF